MKYKKPRNIMNNNERENWIMNDEVLYLAWKSTRLPITKYMRQYRENIDEYIKTATKGYK